MRASGGCPVCIVRHTRRSGRVWRVLCHHPPGACPVRYPGQADSGRNTRRIEYSRRQQKSRPREDGFDGSQRKGQSG